MTETMRGGHEPIDDVREGMTVFDVDGAELGTVAEVKLGDSDAVTDAGQQLQDRDDLMTTVARTLTDDAGLGEQASARLTRLGYLRVDKTMARDVYVAADQVHRVEDDAVHLNTTEDQLIKPE